MKIRPVGAEMLLVDEHTDMAKLIVAFRNFANTPKMRQMITEIQHKSFANLIQHNNALIEKLTVSCLVKTFPDFTEPKDSLPRLLGPANDPYPKPYEFSPHPPTLFRSDPL
jgi:hypothetical protein